LRQESQESAPQLDWTRLNASIRRSATRWQGARRVAAALLLGVSLLALTRAQVDLRGGQLSLRLSLPFTEVAELAATPAAENWAIVREEFREEIHNTLREVLRPQMQTLAHWTEQHEDSQKKHLTQLAHWMETLTGSLKNQYQNDSKAFGVALAETQRDLNRTRNALLTYARLDPSRVREK
jgi:hypothetical protein